MNIDAYVTNNGFIKPDTVATSPIRDVIANCKLGNFERPDLYLQGGGILGLNATNLRTLRNTWGPESDDWIGKEVELYLGKTKWQGEDRDSVLVKCISPPTPWRDKQAQPHKALTRKEDFSDEVPF